MNNDLLSKLQTNHNFFLQISALFSCICEGSMYFIVLLINNHQYISLSGYI